MKPVAPKPKFELFLGKVRILMNTLKKNTFSNELDPENIISKFWQIESYGALEKQN